MSEHLIRRLAILRRDESGQTAFIMLLALPVIFVFFGLAADAGIWFFDHRLAQNQADAAALAAINFLPAPFEELGQATAAVDQWLTKNGSGPEDRSCLEYSDLVPSAAPDGLFDAVRVCVRRESPGLFSGFSGVSFVHVSAVAGARVAPVSLVANVMPWALVPPDVNCKYPGEMCQSDLNSDGVVDDWEDCGYHPPVPGLAFDPVLGDTICPWGMSGDRLWVFKSADAITPGNFAPISACGVGVPNYKDCIEGEIPTGFYATGGTAYVAVQTGNLGIATNVALNSRYAAETQSGPPNYDFECDVESTPHPISGMDPLGKAAAWDAYVENPIARCDFRLVAVALLDHFPFGASEDVLVLGVATFALAKWDRTPPYGNAEGDSTAVAPGARACGEAVGVSNFKCGMAWGYLMENVRPPKVLLGRIGDTDNPFAPIVSALVE